MTSSLARWLPLQTDVEIAITIDYKYGVCRKRNLRVAKALVSKIAEAAPIWLVTVNPL